MSDSYRRMTLATVVDRWPEPFIECTFEGCFLTFVFRKDALERCGIETMSPGQTLLLKGRRGNTNADLWGIDVLEDLKEVH